MAVHRTCDGMKRRDFLKAGALGMGGLSLANYLQLAHAGKVATDAPAKAAIFVNLTGGPTHLDTFDMKPDAPAEYRGLFNPTKTNVDGVEFCEQSTMESNGERNGARSGNRLDRRSSRLVSLRTEE